MKEVPTLPEVEAKPAQTRDTFSPSPTGAQKAPPTHRLSAASAPGLEILLTVEGNETPIKFRADQPLHPAVAAAKSLRAKILNPKATGATLKETLDAAVLEPYRALHALLHALSAGDAKPCVTLIPSQRTDDVGRAHNAFLEVLPDLVGDFPIKLQYEGPQTSLPRTPMPSYDPTQFDQNGRTFVVTGSAGAIGGALRDLLEEERCIHGGRDKVDVKEPQKAAAFVTEQLQQVPDCNKKQLVIFHTAGQVGVGGEGGLFSGTSEQGAKNLKHLLQVNTLGPLELTAALRKECKNVTPVYFGSEVYATKPLRQFMGPKMPFYIISKLLLDLFARARGEGVIDPGWCAGKAGGHDAPYSPRHGASVALAAVDCPGDATYWMPILRSLNAVQSSTGPRRQWPTERASETRLSGKRAHGAGHTMVTLEKGDTHTMEGAHLWMVASGQGVVTYKGQEQTMGPNSVLCVPGEQSTFTAGERCELLTIQRPEAYFGRGSAAIYNDVANAPVYFDDKEGITVAEAVRFNEIASVTLMHMPPSAKNAKHYHDTMTQTLILYSGVLHATVGDTPSAITLRPGHTLTLKPGTTLELKTGDTEGACALLICDPAFKPEFRKGT